MQKSPRRRSQQYPLSKMASKSGTVFRADGLDVVALTGSDAGWAVTRMPAGGWIQFDEVAFSPGNYKVPVRYASTASHTPQLSIDGVALPPRRG
ncbi:carbohydrate-binding domain-containing protein [Pinirhizobacter soli]|uniref:carbohydrate-binding domain-containing protein n=1 Tax=Pinirhizobacter soli TaxID=2786953 RepID=UPI003CCDFA6A